MDKITLKAKLSAFRDSLKGLVDEAVLLKTQIGPDIADNAGETCANITLAYRHLEDAAMRFGKAIQAAHGGVSPLGGPNTPGSLPAKEKVMNEENANVAAPVEEVAAPTAPVEQTDAAAAPAQQEGEAAAQ